MEAYYADIANPGSSAACWLPNHKLIAERGEEKVEIEICYMCSRFAGKSSSGKFDGSFKHETVPQSENVLNRILLNQGVEIK
ncbi:MAG TPA: hypothetical protein VEX64_04695 [Pyrinomonadaceae bacterium]|nr:hypothetical protein [Pyrinomonadaceae bacterium]